jgi:hypothetical protein
VNEQWYRRCVRSPLRTNENAQTHEYLVVVVVGCVSKRAHTCRCGAGSVLVGGGGVAAVVMMVSASGCGCADGPCE